MNRLLPYLDRLMDAGFILLLVLVPLSRGGVREHTQAVAQLVIVLIFSAWCLKVIWGPRPLVVRDDGQGEPGGTGSLNRRRRGEIFGGRVVLSGMELPALLFAVVVLAQLVPVPSPWMQSISPRTVELVQGSVPPAGEEGLTVRGVETWLLEQAEASTRLGNASPGDSLVTERSLDVSTRGNRLQASVAPLATGRHLWTYLTYLMLFIAGLHHWRDRRHADRIIVTLTVMTGLMATYGVLQVLTGEAGLGGWLQNAASGRVPTGPFINANHYAGFLEMALPVTLGLAAAVYERARADRDTSARLLDRGEKFLPQIMLLSMIGVFATVTLVACRSRGGLLALTGAAAAFLLLSPFRKQGSFRLGVAGLLFIGLAMGVAWRVGGDGLWTRYSSLANPEGEASFSFRLDASRRTLEMARDFPYLGVGLGAFPAAYPMYAPGGRVKRTGAAHNDYAQLVAETGAAGSVLALGALLLFAFRFLLPSLLRSGSPRRHVVHGLAVGLLSILLHSLFDFNLQIYSNGMLFVVLGALLAADHNSRLRHSPRSPATVAPAKG